MTHILVNHLWQSLTHPAQVLGGLRREIKTLVYMINTSDVSVGKEQNSTLP